MTTRAAKRKAAREQDICPKCKQPCDVYPVGFLHTSSDIYRNAQAIPIQWRSECCKVLM